uniref:Uncharacterized protein n=1 Tax=Heliothis virescens TaxID=7102 RepID=A0A2A4JGU6_HELVI
MARLLTVLLVLTVVAYVVATPAFVGPIAGTGTASHGSISVGNVVGGKFGADSFSIGHGGQSDSYGSGGHGGNQENKP